MGYLSRHFEIMNIQPLFTFEEAFVRVGQTRQSGCLVAVSTEAGVRIFVQNSAVVSAFGENVDGQAALDRALQLSNAAHFWIPDAKPSKKTMEVNITAYALKHSVARDIHFAKTSKVSLDQVPAVTEHVGPENPSVDKKADKKKLKVYYLLSSEEAEKKYLITKPTVVVGRDDACDIVLNSIQVSRRHCLLQTIARGLSFRDLGSTNGMRVNGYPAQEGFLSAGDDLHLGNYKLTVHAE